MNKYTIYCTEEQTRKAFELGAPLEEAKSLIDAQDRKHLMLENNRGGFYLPYIPTTAQMIGWLEEQGVLVDVEMRTGIAYVYDRKNKVHVKTITIHSRKEGTFVAIDTALEYLENKK